MESTVRTIENRISERGLMGATPIKISMVRTMISIMIDAMIDTMIGSTLTWYRAPSALIGRTRTENSTLARRRDDQFHQWSVRWVRYLRIEESEFF